MAECGELYSFWQLLTETDQIVIPIIQRDYAQGRTDAVGRSMYKEVRETFIDELKNALVENRQLTLDYIYGSLENGFFYPVDGQQRLSTLFLLHWYIGVKERQLDEKNIKILKRFVYATRDTAKEFCSALVDMSFDFSKVDELSKEIRNSNSYFRIYDCDPTVTAMLVMLDRIHFVFKDIDTQLWGRLNNIKFWCLYLERFGLTDDLFIKMNARGKRLSRFDMFKAELESALERQSVPENGRQSAVEKWKINIDNTYLDNFWRVFGKECAERNIFRTVMFLSKCLNSAINNLEYAEEWERRDLTTSFKNEIAFIASNENILDLLCSALETFELWKDKLFVRNLLPDKFPLQGELYHYQRVIIFGCIYWYCVIEGEGEFDKFFRILLNRVYSLREYNNRTRQFNSNIDSKSFSAQLTFVKRMVDEFKASSYSDFYQYIACTDDKNLQFEREKLSYKNLADIEDLERNKLLNRSIHNIFFDGKIHIFAKELDVITESDEAENLCLRIILSYADEKFGMFGDLVFDGTNMQSGKRQLYYNSENDKATAYCHKYLIKGADNGFGDKIFTSDERGSLKGLSDAVKRFIKTFYRKFYVEKTSNDVIAVLREILDERLNECDFSHPQSILWYIVKYKEFFYSLDYTTFLVLRRKKYGYSCDDDNVYDIRCTNQDFDVYSPHYQPFYLALCRSLKRKNSPVYIDENSLSIRDNQIEFAHPCTLSNGWTVRIAHDGDWNIFFNNVFPDKTIVDKYSIDTSAEYFLLKNDKTDCIERLCNFIIECSATTA